MALRVGYRGPCSDARAEQKLLDALGWIVDSCMARAAGQGVPSGFPCAVNNQLRTGADKGNPTVELKQSIVMASKGVDAM